MPSLDEAVTQVLERPVRERSGLVLEAVTVTTAGRRRVVRVVVDLPDPLESGPAGTDGHDEVDLDAVARASEAVSEALDASDVLGEAPYTLEVSSPGVDRPLTAARHWRRARTRLVRAVLADGSSLLGRVVEVDGDGTEGGVLLHLEPQMVKGRPPRAKDVGAPRRLTWAELVRGEVQVEFRRADGPDGTDEPDDDDLDDDDLDDPDELDEGDEPDDEPRTDEHDEQDEDAQ
ncbi:ribosome maturation factor RimP [Kineococcus gynurae]|uniref:Ribosome maturation factor RimP n=1 Tax=Kineococcus gynurae TaxID=452979 RepID=A0ABV5LVI2_9ACTN